MGDLLKLPDNKTQVYQSNNLVSANYDLTITEQRIILFTIARKNPFDDIPRVNYITAQDFSNYFGMSVNKAYERLREASKIMFDRKIVVDKKSDDEIRWLTRKVIYKKGSGAISISYTPEILSELNDLLSKGNFTNFELKKVVGMQSKYSIRLYSKMMQWKSIGKLNISLDDLRLMYELENKYKLYGDLKRKIIDKAIKEITAHANLKIKLEEIKKGRKVVSLTIRFEENKQLTLIGN